MRWQGKLDTEILREAINVFLDGASFVHLFDSSEPGV
jgi:hypothetical protein